MSYYSIGGREGLIFHEGGRLQLRPGLKRYHTLTCAIGIYSDIVRVEYVSRVDTIFVMTPRELRAVRLRFADAKKCPTFTSRHLLSVKVFQDSRYYPCRGRHWPCNIEFSSFFFQSYGWNKLYLYQKGDCHALQWLKYEIDNGNIHITDAECMGSDYYAPRGNHLAAYRDGEENYQYLQPEGTNWLVSRNLGDPDANAHLTNSRYSNAADMMKMRNHLFISSKNCAVYEHNIQYGSNDWWDVLGNMNSPVCGKNKGIPGRASKAVVGELGSISMKSIGTNFFVVDKTNSKILRVFRR